MAVKNISAEELKDLIKNHNEEIQIIDVREPHEYEIIHIKNSKLIPLSELQSRLGEIDWNKEVIFLCRSGARSGRVANAFSQMGHDVLNVQGGIHEYFKEGKDENLEVDEESVKNYF